VPWVRIVIVNYNSGPLLEQTVAALTRQTDPDFEAVIIDNASCDGSERVPLPDRRFRLHRAAANLGFAAASNLGCKGSGTPWLAMLNPDAAPEPDWLAELRRATNRHPDAAAFGSTQLDAANPKFLDGGGDCYSIFGIAWRGGHGAPIGAIGGDIRVFSPCAAAALYRRDVFERAGGFAEPFFCYLEDVDLGFRLNLLGHEAIQAAGARVRHVGGACSGKTAGGFGGYHIVRNGVFTIVRCMPAPLLAISLPLAILSQLWLGLRAGDLPVRVRGLRDGFAALPVLLRQRRAIQADRRLSVLELSRLLVWNPRAAGGMAIVPLPRARG